MKTKEKELQLTERSLIPESAKAKPPPNKPEKLN